MFTLPAEVASPANQIDSDDQLVALWLRGRSEHTLRAYQSDVGRFMAHVGKPLRDVTREDLQAFADSLADLALTSRYRALATLRSLLAFGHRIGYLVSDAGRDFSLQVPERGHPERELSEDEVHHILALEPDRRNRALLRLLYAAGLRVSEVCALTWRDLQPTREGGRVTVLERNGVTRAVLLPASVWNDLLALRGDAPLDAPMFRSQKGGHLNETQVFRIVRQAAKRAGIEEASPFSLRHAHASHALSRGAPLQLVQATLGHTSAATTSRYLHALPEGSSAMLLSVAEGAR
ncbi:MAG: tyrosine-type recombinase/integrase [Sphingomonadaceae bacterium]